MNDGTYRRLAEAILVAHQRHDVGGVGGCLCGRLDLGESWAAHVAEILDQAGALSTGPPRRYNPEAPR